MTFTNAIARLFGGAIYIAIAVIQAYAASQIIMIYASPAYYYWQLTAIAYCIVFLAVRKPSDLKWTQIALRVCIAFPISVGLSCAFLHLSPPINIAGFDILIPGPMDWINGAIYWCLLTFCFSIRPQPTGANGNVISGASSRPFDDVRSNAWAQQPVAPAQTSAGTRQGPLSKLKYPAVGAGLLLAAFGGANINAKHKQPVADPPNGQHRKPPPPPIPTVNAIFNYEQTSPKMTGTLMLRAGNAANEGTFEFSLKQDAAAKTFKGSYQYTKQTRIIVLKYTDASSPDPGYERMLQSEYAGHEEYLSWETLDGVPKGILNATTKVRETLRSPRQKT